MEELIYWQLLVMGPVVTGISKIDATNNDYNNEDSHLGQLVYMLPGAQININTRYYIRKQIRDIVTKDVKTIEFSYILTGKIY